VFFRLYTTLDRQYKDFFYCFYESTISKWET